MLQKLLLLNSYSNINKEGSKLKVLKCILNVCLYFKCVHVFHTSVCSLTSSPEQKTVDFCPTVYVLLNFDHLPESKPALRKSPLFD